MNCLEPTNLYAICCPNTCEALMSHLESELGAQSAKPARIAELVANLGSEMTQAPRNLSSTLLQRLDEAAAHSGGEVPLHGRLFAQWMHHAYPLECLYPHEPGTINPQSREEWLHADEQASDEVIARHIEQEDACAVNWQGRVECEQEAIELPWSMTEELISTKSNTPSFQQKPKGIRGFATVLVLGIPALALVAAAVTVFGGKGKS